MRFEFIAGDLCLDFANTVHDWRGKDKGEELRAITDLLEWAREARVLSEADHQQLTAHYKRNLREATAALNEGVALRNLLLSIFSGIANGRALSSQRLVELNSALARFPGLLHVDKKSGGLESAWRSATDGLPQILFPILTSAAELLAGDRLGRIRECASADCTWLFVDESRNRSRRWCDMSACGNRMKARLHYQRARAAQ